MLTPISTWLDSEASIANENDDYEVIDLEAESTELDVEASVKKSGYILILD